MTRNPSADLPGHFSHEFDIPEAQETSPAKQEKLADPGEPNYMTMPPVDKPRWNNIKARIVSRTH